MKAKLLATIGLFAIPCLINCKGSKYPNIVGTPTDYSKNENWMVKQYSADKAVDVFYLYPTSADPTCKDDVAPIDSVMKTNAWVAYERGPSCFQGFANMYAPYYRQISATKIAKSPNGEDFSNTIYNSVVRTDAYAALDYYFEHYNNGRPFILASHSQGSFTMRHVLGEYMSIHKDYYSRMIAAYTIGTCYNKEYLDKYPHVKMATGEDDTGATITWNTYSNAGTKIEEGCFLNYGTNPYCINPLNWKVDDTEAEKSENKGTYDVATHEVVTGVTGAKIDTENHALICTDTLDSTKYPTYAYLNKTFGHNSLHFDDWNLFYKNIQENAQKRIAKYFK